MSLPARKRNLVIELRLDRESLVTSVAQQFLDGGGERPEFTAPPTSDAIDLFLPQNCGRQAQTEHGRKFLRIGVLWNEVLRRHEDYRQAGCFGFLVPDERR
jgi:hypothetical protein